MKIEFKGVTRFGESISSNSIIQKKINNVLYIRLWVKTQWILINNESLEINYETNQFNSLNKRGNC
jgi:hypothetical protein